MFSCCIRPPPDTASKYSAHGPEAAENTTHSIVAAGSSRQPLAPAPQALHTLHNPRHPQLKQEVPPQNAARPSASPAAFVPFKPVYSTAHPPPQPIPSEQPSPVDSARLDQPWSELAAAATSAQGVLQPVHATPPRDSLAAKGQQLSGHSGDRYRAWDPNTPRTPAPRTADSSPITPRSASVSDLSEPDVYQKYGSSADSEDEGQEAANLDPSTDLDAFRQRQATAGDEAQQQLLEQHSSYVSAVSHPSALASPSAPQSPAASHAAQLPPSFHRPTSPTHHQQSPFQHGGRQQQGGPGGAAGPWAAPSGLHAAEWHTNDSSHAPAAVHSSKAAGLVGGSAWHAVLHQNPHLGLGGEQASPCNPVYSSPGHPQQSLGSSPDSSPDKAAGKPIPTFRPQGPSLPMTSSVGMRTISTAVQQLQQQRAGLHPHPPAPHPPQAPSSGVLPPATPAPPSQPHPSSLLSSSSSAQLPPALTAPLSQACCFSASSISSPAAPSVLPTHTPTPLTPPDKSSGLSTPAAASHTPFSTKPSQAADQQQLDGMAAAAATAAAEPANCHSQPIGDELQPRRVSQGAVPVGPLTLTTSPSPSPSPSAYTPVSQAGAQGVPPTTSTPRSSEHSPPAPPLPRYQQPTAASAARSALSPALSCSSSSSLPASSRRASQAGEAEGGEGAAAAASHLTPRTSLTRRTSQPGAAPPAPGLASLPPAAAAHPPLTLPGHPRPGASGSSSRPGSLRSSRSGGEQQQQQQGEPGAPKEQAAAPAPGSVVAGAVEQGSSSSTGSRGPRGSQLPSAGAAGRVAPGAPPGMDAKGKEGKAGGEGLGSSSPGARANSAPVTRVSGRPHPPGTPPGPSSKAGGASPGARSPELASNKVQRKVGELGNGQGPASPPAAAPGAKAGASRAAHAPNAKTSATHIAHSPVAKTSATHAAHAPPGKTGNPASGTTQGNHVGPGDKAAGSTSAHGTTAHSTQSHAQPSKGGSGSSSSSSKGSDAMPEVAAGPDAAAGAGGPGAASRPAAAPPPAPSATPPGSLPYGQWRLVRVQEVGGRRCAACDGTVAQETNDGEQEIFECDQVLAPGTLAAGIEHERYEEDSEASQPHLWLFCVDPLCLDSKPYRSRLPAWPKKMMLDTGVKITRSEFANIKDMGMDVAAPAAPKP